VKQTQRTVGDYLVHPSSCVEVQNKEQVINTAGEGESKDDDKVIDSLWGEEELGEDIVLSSLNV